MPYHIILLNPRDGGDPTVTGPSEDLDGANRCLENLIYHESVVGGKGLEDMNLINVLVEDNRVEDVFSIPLSDREEARRRSIKSRGNA